MADIERTYRWRQRAVMPVRPTWLAMVVVLFLMTHRSVLHANPTLGQSGKVGLFILIVVLPTLALALWRCGLLPPERVESTHEG